MCSHMPDTTRLMAKPARPATTPPTNVANRKSPRIVPSMCSLLTRVMYASATGHEKRDVWLRYGRWLVAGLTFQLAADIIETSIAPSWKDIGQVAAIALIRTFLNFFLERDL